MIRHAEPRDIPQLLEMGKSMHAESQWGDVPLSLKKLEELFNFLMQSSDAFFIVSERAGTVIGTMAATIYEHWMSEAKVTCDLFLYVDPEYRGSMTAMRLINHYTAWGISRRAGKIMFGAMTGVNPESTARLFGRAGYHQIGTMHQYAEAF